MKIKLGRKNLKSFPDFQAPEYKNVSLQQQSNIPEPLDLKRKTDLKKMFYKENSLYCS